MVTAPDKALGPRDPNAVTAFPPGSIFTHNPAELPAIAARMDKENAVTATAKSKPNPKKRKSDANDETDVKALLFPDDAPYIDEDDNRLRFLDPKGYSCQQVRLKIRKWLESGAMKVGEFQWAIGVSQHSYSNFVNRTGT